VARYFAAQQAALEALQTQLESVTASLSELEEEHSGEDAAFSGFEKINAAAIKDRLKELKAEQGDWKAAEEAVLNQWLKLSGPEAILKKSIKEADAALDKLAYEKYPALSVAEIQTLVIDDKWMAALTITVQGELDRVSQTLTTRIRELAERYATPLPQLVEEVAGWAARVDAHLKKMGVVWN
jgi:hypothetical protein